MDLRWRCAFFAQPPGSPGQPPFRKLSLLHQSFPPSAKEITLLSAHRCRPTTGLLPRRDKNSPCWTSGAVLCQLVRPTRAAAMRHAPCHWGAHLRNCFKFTRGAPPATAPDKPALAAPDCPPSSRGSVAVRVWLAPPIRGAMATSGRPRPARVLPKMPGVTGGAASHRAIDPCLFISDSCNTLPPWIPG